MGSLSGTCDIVEARKEKDPIQYSKGSYRPNFRSSEKSPRLPPLKVRYNHSLDKEINQLLEAVSLKGTPKNTGLSHVGTGPLQKNALKKPITITTRRSPEIGFSEPASLKETLRDVCVSKASGVAAMRRLTQSADFSGASEAGRIKSLYNSVVVESNQSGLGINDSKGSTVKISFVPKDRKPNSSPKTPEHIRVPKVKSLSKSAHSSPRLSAFTTPNSTKTTLLKYEIASDSRKIGIQKSKKEIARKDRNGSASSHSNTVDNMLDGNENIPSSTKMANKVKSSSPGYNGRLLRVSPSDSIDGNKSSKSSRKVKPKDVDTKVQPDLSTLDAGINASGVSKSQLLCERCHCTLKTMNKESRTNSLVSICTSLATELNSSNATSSTLKQSIALDSSNRSEAPSSLNSSSHGGYSTSTASFSYENNVRRSSCSTRPHMSKDLKWGAIRHIRQQGTFGLKHFKILKKLGAGDIGDVYLAKLISTNCLFALKVMDNEFLERRQKMPRVQTERKVLKMLDHPFLPTLYAHFTSDNLSCLVMDYCSGGDLHVLRQKQPGRTFSESAARFYVAEVLLAIEYLHMLGVIYRDLKPENVLVREDGHIMLTDFDLSLRCSVNPTLLKSSSTKPDPIKLSRQYTESSNSVDPFCMVPSCQVSCFSPRFLPNTAKTRKLKPDPSIQARSLPQLIVEPTDARSNSFVGTHEYLAPEIIQGEGHGAAVDWWTLGVFLYELLYGRTPFRGSNNEETLANVVLQRLDFPDSLPVSSRGRDLIRRLLVKEAKNRFGSEKGAAEIKQHPFFHGLNWALIRCASPPELPELFDYDVSDTDVQEENRYLECKAKGDHLEFELF